MSEAPVATEHMQIPGSEPPTGVVLVSEGCAVAWALFVWVTCAAIWSHGGIQTRPATEEQVWFQDTIAARDVSASCYSL